MSGGPTLEQVVYPDGIALQATGPWTAHHAADLEQMVGNAELLAAGRRGILIDLSRVSQLDTFGAWFIERMRRSFSKAGAEPKFTGLSDTYSPLVDEVSRVQGPEELKASRLTPVLVLERVGRAMVELFSEISATLKGLTEMTGAIVYAGYQVIRHPSHFRLTSMVHHLEHVCWRAVPIILIVTFLVGSIISQQGIFHFSKFGAGVFVVDMLGVLTLRELGVLIVAIMVAGRSGSSYTAELGSMKMREEIDALRTMGFDPTEVLIVPRLLALIIALPMLTFLGVIAGLFGGGLVAWLYGGLPPDAFLGRLREVITIDHFIVGMIKAPFMAFVIGTIACVQGLAVEGSAESLGQHTTASVVQSIFFVIVLDGIFAIFFASIGL
ncbi:MlaE family lipid ABC transporter permease subunit [Bradyrhizobium sp. LHD-71]|uniref:MlaE family lipid ABC transporter permease subunit n=1 Tax=Bradyrhizobium sp. LHD-71 TaxID=3072141 RepID=UPI00280E48BB|nr:MlaE family lipid ABC transporter permease subunit [Bradyrhizobium sp. LHD-71]MDQ8728460.1 MlaE family lipid ABC transporter permease subunit [Bradyrhizobium sp. LHD-71]